MSQTLQVVKRDGRVVPFDGSRIERAIDLCYAECSNEQVLHYKADWIAKELESTIVHSSKFSETVGVEQIQDLVEEFLMIRGEPEAAKRYILYRAEHAQLRGASEEIPDNVRAAFDADKPYFPTVLQQFQFYDKYSRFNYELGRRETWIETVERTVDFLHELAGDRLDSSVYREIRSGILEMRVMPSMRLLAMAGPAARRNNIAVYNCSYQAVDSLDAFPEALLISMAGCGVGFSVERKFVEDLPVIKAQRAIRLLFQVEDSSEGWAAALRTGLAYWYDGCDVTFDYSLIRPQGAILLTKGGRASGPAPLKQLLDFCRDTILNAQGRKLRPIEVHDMMCMVGSAAVSGGVRRTAMISLFDQDDHDMLTAKSGTFPDYRWNANNSMVWQNVATTSQAEFVNRFMTMINSGNGEPGIFSRENAKLLMPSRRDKNHDFGTNPCFAAGTLVQAKSGHFPIEDLIGKTVDIWNGTDWQSVDNFRITSENEPMLKITLHDGSEIRATRYHTFILENGVRLPAYDLVPGMRLEISTAPKTHGSIEERGAYLKGFLLADGTRLDDRPSLNLYQPKWVCEERLIDSALEIPVEALRTNAIAEPDFHLSGENRRAMTGIGCRKIELLPWTTDYKFGLPTEVFQWDLRSKAEFIAGLFDGDGTASDTRNGFLYQLSSISRTFLQDVQTLLKTMGARSHLSLMKSAGVKDFNDGYGEYPTQDCWRLTLGQTSAIALARVVTFSRLVSFANKATCYQLKPKFNRIAKIELDGVDERVYCCTVEGSHSFSLSNGIHSAQCGEIILRSRQFCNLSAVVARAGDNYQDLREKIQLATIIGTIQSLATTFPGLRSDWKTNCEDERLLGVDITGQQDTPDSFDDTIFRWLRETAIDTNQLYAIKLGINESAAITCVKPSGNTSTLVDCSSGLHARWSEFEHRNVRVAASSPTYKVLKDAGWPLVPENGSDLDNVITYVASFPVKAPESAVTRNDLSAVDQCDWWLLNKLNYTEHNPSVTITYRPDEVIELLAWVYQHRNQIGGMAFFPNSDGKYALLPRNEITEEQYETLKALCPRDVDWSRIFIYEKEDRSTASTTGACEGPVCLIDG